jgi:hypothetical protein
MPPRGREDFMAMVEHGLKVAGAKTKLLSEQALELLWRVSHGLPRQASRLLRTSLMLAHDRDQSFVDERVMLDACDELQLGRPTTVSRGTDESVQSRGERETKSRK